MERRTPIFIIASRRPRVGKTLLARTLAEFLRSEDRPAAAFDCNPGEFALVDYLPGDTAVADITETKDQITLFDQLLAEDRVPKVVDVGHSLFDKFFTVIQQIGFVEEARHAVPRRWCCSWPTATAAPGKATPCCEIGLPIFPSCR